MWDEVISGAAVNTHTSLQPLGPFTWGNKGGGGGGGLCWGRVPIQILFSSPMLV